ncbi:Y+L amino acid transporter 2 [Holothuria leucospilota]|uniref:Y+L amino acid transporter 2 n=1 Tax=Holothuria leucospilota TaxID=206669 RepID=A0A9Q1BQD8_HOLLE|nr:Y+L amino acid transporter 2 [Holothuria leucospilota]
MDGGWSTLNNLTEEIKKPEKTVPRAIFGTLIIVFCIYMSANVSYLTVMTPSEMLASEAVAVTFAIRTLNNWSWTVWLCVALSAAGQLTGALLSGTRMYFVASREGALPEVLSLVHVRRRTPLPAVAVTVSLVVMYT